jgi:hypothetical protein
MTRWFCKSEKQERHGVDPVFGIEVADTQLIQTPLTAVVPDCFLFVGHN